MLGEDTILNIFSSLTSRRSTKPKSGSRLLAAPGSHAVATTPAQRLGVCFAHSIQPYQPSPKGLSGRPAHRPFRDAMGQMVGEMAPSSLEATRRWSIPCQNSTT